MTPKYSTQRRLVNYLLQPLVQLRVGLVNVVLSLVFVAGIGTYAYGRFVQFSDVVATLTQADDQVASLVAAYLRSVGGTVLAASVGFVLVNLLASIYVTHRLVGPTVAFRRHIRGLLDGNFDVKTKLRRGDAFGEVAEDLNRLSERLGEMSRDGLVKSNVTGLNAQRARRPG